MTQRTQWAPAAIVLAALILRLWSVGSESVWLDEATSIWLAKMDVPNLVRWTAVDIHPPFYYTLLHFWLLLGDSEAVVRSLSVLTGVASVAVLFVLARRLFGERTALFAAALLAVSPLHIWYSQEVRMYALIALLGLLSSYFMILALAEGKGWHWLAYIVCAALSFYTHYYAVFIALFQNIVMYIIWRRGDVPQRTVRYWALAQALVALLFLPWLPTLISQVQAGGGGWVARGGNPGLGALVSTAVAYSVGPDLSWISPWLRRVAYLAFGGLIVLGLLPHPTVAKNERFGAMFALVWLVVPIAAAWLVSQVKPLYSLRYLLPFLPAYYILVGRGLSRISLDWLRPLALAAVCAAGLAGVAGSATHMQQTDWRAIAGYVLRQSDQNTVVVFAPGWNWKPFDYYARGAVDMLGDTPLPIRTDQVVDVVAQAQTGHTALWLVWDRTHYADPPGNLQSFLDAAFPRRERQEFGAGIVLSRYDTVGRP